MCIIHVFKLGLEKPMKGSYYIPEVDVLIFLPYVASGSFMDIAGELCTSSKATAWRSIHRVLDRLVHISPQHIRFPEDLNRVSSRFERTCGFPGVIGCIDGTHVPIQVPLNDRSETFDAEKVFSD